MYARVFILEIEGDSKDDRMTVENDKPLNKDNTEDDGDPLHLHGG